MATTHGQRKNHQRLWHESLAASVEAGILVLVRLFLTNTATSHKRLVQCVQELLWAPGRSINAKSGFDKSILDQGRGKFSRQLEYKQAWLGGEVFAVDPRSTSRTCPACDHICTENRNSNVSNVGMLTMQTSTPPSIF
jgi:transposase